MTRRRPAEPTPAAQSHLERQEAWAGVVAGERIDVLDARERGGAWTFLAHVVNTQTGDAWVEVLGGRGGDRRLRSFRPDQLYPYQSVRAGAPSSPSLADAPRLAL